MMSDAREILASRHVAIVRQAADRGLRPVDVDRRAATQRERRLPTIAIVGIVQATGVLTFDFGDEMAWRMRPR